MRTTKLLLTAATPLLLLLACSKKGKNADAPASVSIVHAITNGKPVIPVFGTDPVLYFSGARTIAYSAASLYSPVAGNNALYVVKSTDTTKTLLKGSFNFESGGIYTLFLSGDTTKPDTTLVQDLIPRYSDSSTGLRFVHLSPASAAINVNIKGNAVTQTEFTNLAYRQVSTFKQFGATTAAGTRYIFEVRNKPNDSLLLTYTWTYPRFKNQTLILSGAVNASGKPASLKIIPVNNY